MVDPLAHHESAHELEELAEKAHECGSVTAAEIAQVAARIGATVQEVWRELESRGVTLPSGVLTASTIRTSWRTSRPPKTTTT
jgi:hypothetical protein